MNHPDTPVRRVFVVAPDAFVAEDAAIIVADTVQKAVVATFNDPDAAARAMTAAALGTKDIAIVIGPGWNLSEAALVERLGASGGVMILLTSTSADPGITGCRILMGDFPFSEKTLVGLLEEAALCSCYGNRQAP